jgi:ParB family chromosome partitioning protein
MSSAPHSQPPADQIVHLDPRVLVPNPRNPRTTLGDLDELTASIGQSGVLEPLIVAPSEVGGHLVLFGRRRREAAIAADVATVPCIVRADYTAKDSEQVADMLAENLHRADLTPVEEADGYAQLAAFDWTAEQIATRVGRKPQRVRHGLAVAGLPEQVRPKVAAGEWTLEQAAGVEEFAGDEKAMARLAKATGHYLHFALAEERDKRDRKARAMETRQQLADHGVRIIAKPKDFPWYSVAVPLDQLTEAAGRRLTAGKHRRCPGHAAVVDTDGTPIFLCQHPRDYDHQTPPGYRHRSREEAEAEHAEAEARRQFAHDWTVATEARRSFLREYLARRGKAPAGTLRVATTLLYGYPAYRTPDLDGVADLLGLAADDPKAALAQTAAKTGETRLPLLMLACAAASAEANLEHVDRPWGYNPALAAHWLTIVAELGYPLTDVEQQVATSARRQVEENAVADAATDESDAEDNPATA